MDWGELDRRTQWELWSGRGEPTLEEAPAALAEAAEVRRSWRATLRHGAIATALTFVIVNFAAWFLLGDVGARGAAVIALLSGAAALLGRALADRRRARRLADTASGVLARFPGEGPPRED